MTLREQLNQHRERMFLKRCKTPTKVFIGGMVVGIFIGILLSAIVIGNLI